MRKYYDNDSILDADSDFSPALNTIQSDSVLGRFLLESSEVHIDKEAALYVSETAAHFSHDPSVETADTTTVSDYTSILSILSWWGYPRMRTGAGVFITYSFEEASDAPTFEPFSASAKEAARAALKMWADVCGITFFETMSGSGDIRFSSGDLGSGLITATI